MHVGRIGWADFKGLLALLVLVVIMLLLHLCKGRMLLSIDETCVFFYSLWHICSFNHKASVLLAFEAQISCRFHYSNVRTELTP